MLADEIKINDNRYDLHWGVNGVGHFLDAENILNKFLPFVHEVFFLAALPALYYIICLK